MKKQHDASVLHGMMPVTRPSMMPDLGLVVPMDDATKQANEETIQLCKDYHEANPDNEGWFISFVSKKTQKQYSQICAAATARTQKPKEMNETDFVAIMVEFTLESMIKNNEVDIIDDDEMVNILAEPCSFIAGLIPQKLHSLYCQSIYLLNNTTGAKNI